jgi:hypothetical protein
MLYDDIQQLEVRYVISLEYHDVDVYGGGELIPEGELWIKRNAIRLRRKQTYNGDKKTSLPFFLFGENISEKEDFYFALLKNLEKNENQSLPEPQQFEVRHIVSLVQKLHSSEEHLQTRWLNAMMGRLFLAMYKTPKMEEFFRNKLTKKISRVKKPNLITKLALQKIELGEGAPFVTNPRLKDLTVNGDCTVEADVLYTGNFRIEIAATARIDLGSRFKVREVELVLAVTCKRIEGHCLVRFKPAPSNRLWFTFEKMPKIDLTIEPIVSSRQITYSIILKAIESRIREVVAETIVLPFWDDAPFLDTSAEHFRGGIWKKTVRPPPTTEIQSEDPEDEAEAGDEGIITPEFVQGRDDRIMSMPVLPGIKDPLKSRAGRKSAASSSEALGTSTGVERPSIPEPPRALRPTAFATVADPMLTVNHADVNTTARREDASASLKDLSARSLTTSPTESPASTPPTELAISAAMKGRTSSNSSKASADSLHTGHTQERSVTSSILDIPSQSSFPPTPTTESFDSQTPSLNEEPHQNKSFASAARSFNSADRKQAIASLSAATAAAQKWGWGVLNKNKQKDGQAAGSTEAATPRAVPTVPMGRGRPLPPPGIPLPPPERSGINPMIFSLPKRKPLPPPMLPKRPDLESTNSEASPQPSPKPPLPDRRRRQSAMQTSRDPADEVLVVEAPAESAPTSPMQDEHHDEFFGHGEGEVENTKPSETIVRPELPPRTLSSTDPTSEEIWGDSGSSHFSHS